MTGVQAHYPDRSVCINVSFIPHLLRSNLWLTDCLVLRDSAYLTSVRGTSRGIVMSPASLRCLWWSGSLYFANAWYLDWSKCRNLVSDGREPACMVSGYKGGLQMVGSKKLSCDWDEFSLCS